MSKKKNNKKALDNVTLRIEEEETMKKKFPWKKVGLGAAAIGALAASFVGGFMTAKHSGKEDESEEFDDFYDEVVEDADEE